MINMQFLPSKSNYISSLIISNEQDLKKTDIKLIIKVNRTLQTNVYLKNMTKLNLSKNVKIKHNSQIKFFQKASILLEKNIAFYTYLYQLISI